MLHRETLHGALCFYYDDALFKPGTDSFLLGAYARPKPNNAVCDLGAGTGLLGLLLLAREPSLTIYNVELQGAALALAEKSFADSGLSAHGRFSAGDLRDRAALPPAGSMDYAVSNPPYFPPGSGAASPDAARRTARSEETCSPDELFTAAAYVLRWGGTFSLVHRAERLTDLLCAARAHALEPKGLRFVQSTPSAPPQLVLLRCLRGGKSGLTVETPLLLQEANGEDSAEKRRIYFKGGSPT